MKNSVSDCSFYINSEEEDDEEKDKKSIEDGNDSDSSRHFTDFLWAHIYERFSTEKRRRNTCAVCAETVKWVAYGPCGYREVCSTCIFRLCFIYGSACARVNLRSSLSPRLGISCNLSLPCNSICVQAWNYLLQDKQYIQEPAAVEKCSELSKQF